MREELDRWLGTRSNKAACIGGGVNVTGGLSFSAYRRVLAPGSHELPTLFLKVLLNLGADVALEFDPPVFEGSAARLFLLDIFHEAFHCGVIPWEIPEDCD